MASHSPSRPSPAEEAVRSTHEASSTWQLAFKKYELEKPDSHVRLIKICPALSLDSHGNAVFSGDPIALVENVAQEMQSVRRDLAQSIRTEQEDLALSKFDVTDHALYTLSVHAEAIVTAPSFDTYAAAAVGLAAAVFSQISRHASMSEYAWDAHAQNIQLMLIYSRHDLDHQSDEALRSGISKMYSHILRHMYSLCDYVWEIENADGFRRTGVEWYQEQIKIRRLDESCQNQIETIAQAENNSSNIERAEKEPFQLHISRHQIDQHRHINAALRTAEVGCLEADLRLLCGLDLAAIPERAPRTCHWFTGHPDFIRWRTQDCSSLMYFCAHSGAGKTVLCKYLLQHEGLHLTSPNKDPILLCGYFFDQDSQHEPRPPEAMSSLIHQLMLQVPELCRTFIHRVRDLGNLSSDQTALWLILVSVIRDSDCLHGKEITCIIDGFDIRRQDPNSRLLLSICEYFQIGDEGSRDGSAHGAVLKMLITSRPSAELPGTFTTFVKAKRNLPRQPRIRYIGDSTMSDDADAPPFPDFGKREREYLATDVKHATHAIVEHKCTALGIPVAERDEMKRTLSNRKHQSYHALHIALDSMLDSYRSLQISGPSTDGDLQVAEARGSSFSLDTYAAALSSSSASTNGTIKLLRLILAAQRPFTVREAHLALALHGESTSYESWNEIFLDTKSSWDLRSIGGMFVDIKSDQIYASYHLWHFLQTSGCETANGSRVKHQQECPWAIVFSKGQCHLELADVCISLLNFSKDVERFGRLPKELRADGFGDGQVQNNFRSETAGIGERFPLMAYALDNIAHHLNEADGLLGAGRCRLIFNTLCNTSSPVRSLWTVPQMRKKEADFPPPKSDCKALLFARLGLLEGMRLERDAGISLSARTPGSNRLPIDEAAIGGHLKAAMFLLHEVYCKPIDMIHELSRMSLSPLWEACYAANADVALELTDHHPLWMHKPMQGLSPIFALMLSPEPDRTVFARLHKHNCNCRCQEKYPTSVQPRETSETSDDNFLVFEEMDARCLTTLLILASARGILGMVELLLEMPDTDVNGNGDEQRLEAAFELGGISTRWLDGGKSTALLWAIKGGHSSVCDALIAGGADVNKSSGPNGVFPLYMAALGRSESLVSKLSKNSLNFNQVGGLHRTALRAAIVADAYYVVHLFPNDGVIPSEGDNSDLVHLAVRYCRLRILRLLLYHAADIDARGRDGSTPIYVAAFHRPGGTEGGEIFDFLLENGCDPDLEGGYFGFPLQVAALYGDISRVAALLDAGANANAYGGAHSTALHAACANMHIDAVKLLLARGANPNIPDIKGRTCLLTSIEARAFADKTFDSNAGLTEASGATASTADQVRNLVETLLTAGVDCNAKDHEDETPLLAAINQGSHSDRLLVRQLLAARADVNHITPNGMTALRRACMAGSRDLVHLLYHHGAEPDLRYYNERSPLEEAVFRGYEGIAGDLISFGADISARGAEGATMIERAFGNDDMQAARFLLLHSATVENPESDTIEKRSGNEVSPQMMELVHELLPDLAELLAVSRPDDSNKDSISS